MVRDHVQVRLPVATPLHQGKLVWLTTCECPYLLSVLSEEGEEEGYP